MKLSKKVLILYSGRILIINLCVIFILNISEIHFRFMYPTFFCANLFATILLLLRYRCTSINTSGNLILLKTGFLIKKEQQIYRSRICAERHIYTPLSKVLGLANSIVYCEGIAVLFPALTNIQLSTLGLHRDEACLEI